MRAVHILGGIKVQSDIFIFCEKCHNSVLHRYIHTHSYMCINILLRVVRG